MNDPNKTEEEVNHFNCTDLSLILGREDKRMKYQVIQVDIDKAQMYHGSINETSLIDAEMVIDSFSIAIQFRTSTFFTVFSIIKCVFVLMSLISFCMYWRVLRRFSHDDLGIV